MQIKEKAMFASDYMEGAHPSIIERLTATNLDKTEGYGEDPYTLNAKELIRKACDCPGAEVEFLMGGTQTNAVVIDALLRSYQGILAAQTGHIFSHEAGAIETGGHRVITLPQQDGKITAQQIQASISAYAADGNKDHMVMPAMVYISQPTECGTIYSKQELTDISCICRENGLILYVDGARLAYALGCSENDVTLPDLAKLCDVFYIGGTKCGALFGEAVVVPDRNLIPHFFTIMKQHGAVLAKGRLLGVQFGVLFEDGLYEEIGKSADRHAMRIKEALIANGYKIFFDSPTNQVFFEIEDSKLDSLAEKVSFGFWDKSDADHTIIRFAPSWATTDENVDRLIAIINEM